MKLRRVVTGSIILLVLLITVFLGYSASINVEALQYAGVTRGGTNSRDNIFLQVKSLTEKKEEDAERIPADLEAIANYTLEEKEKLIAPNGAKPIREGANQDAKDIIEGNLTTITFTARNENGDDYHKSLTVHAAIAENVKAAFEEIYEKTDFCIIDNQIGCYDYRVIADTSKLSWHSYGIAVDINWEHNKYNPNDLKECSTCHSPCGGVDDKLHIRTPDHPVVKILKKYGIGWAYEDTEHNKAYVDFMHFSYMFGN